VRRNCASGRGLQRLPGRVGLGCWRCSALPLLTADWTAAGGVMTTWCGRQSMRGRAVSQRFPSVISFVAGSSRFVFVRVYRCICSTMLTKVCGKKRKEKECADRDHVHGPILCCGLRHKQDAVTNRINIAMPSCDMTSPPPLIGALPCHMPRSVPLPWEAAVSLPLTLNAIGFGRRAYP
jgi:hypothetical protein